MDIVERLHQEIGGYTDAHLEKAETNMREAADEIERLRKRVELLEGYLNGALNVVEGFVHCDTKEARKALEREE